MGSISPGATTGFTISNVQIIQQYHICFDVHCGRSKPELDH
jgi:hypothetical protein